MDCEVKELKVTQESGFTAEDHIFDSLPIPGLSDLWQETQGDSRVCIAVLDGPIDQSHPSLLQANLSQIDTLVSGSGDQGPAASHGTHVASVIFGQHGSPVMGIAPHCCGLVAPVFNNSPDGSIAPCSQLDLARAITQAVEAGAQIINISGGELSPSGTADPLLADAVQSCVDNNVLIIAAAGNDGCECLHVPGALPSVLAVGAMNEQGMPMGFSNWGQEYRFQGVLALGDEIPGAVPGGGITTQSGTSYATPVVSGIAALLLSLQIKMGQEPDPQAVRAAILESAYSCNPQAVADCRPFMVGSLNVPGAKAIISTAEPALSAAGISKHTLSNNGERMMLNIGDTAPDFSVKDHSGQEVRLSDYRGQTVALWFYPQADTPG